MRRHSAFDDGEPSDSEDDDLGTNLRVSRTTEHVGLVRPSAAVKQQRLSEPTITHHAASRSLSDPSLQIDRHDSQLRLIASKIERPVSPQPTQTDNPLGLTLIHCPLSPQFDLVFVHGLGGTSVGTWSHERVSSFFWPPWLADDTVLSSCRTFTFGYNAAFATQYSSAGILDFAKDLLFRMRMFSGDTTEDGPSIGTVSELPIFSPEPMIAKARSYQLHSLRIPWEVWSSRKYDTFCGTRCHRLTEVSQAYVIGKSDPQYSQIMTQIRSIVFLATPHKGSQYADMLNNILKAIPHSSAKQYVTDIAQNSGALQEINEQFRNICGNLDLISFYETQRTNMGPGFKRIVSRTRKTETTEPNRCRLSTRNRVSWDILEKIHPLW